MFKQKYLGFLVLGLALGIGLFGFITYSIKNDTAVKEPQFLEQAKSIATVSGEAIPKEETPPLGNSSKAVVAGMSKDIPYTNREKNMLMLLEHRKQQDAINDQKEQLAKERWAEFVKNQPHELSALIFDMQGDSAYQAGEAYTDKSYYLKHFEDELSDWGEQAKYALENYFSSESDGSFNILRIDCRSSMCEIAGQMHNIQVNLANYQPAKNSLVTNWNDLSKAMANSEEMNNLFILQGQRPLNYALPAENGLFSVPFSIFIYRNYQSTPVPSPY